MMKALSSRLAIVVAATTVVATAACAQPTISLCGTEQNPKPAITPIIPNSIWPRSLPAFECAMWQSFIYLSWPASEDAPGTPDLAKPFGSPGPTVWERFKSHEQVFLPSGETPGPWRSLAAPPGVSGPLADSIAKGQLRFLRQETKVSSQLTDSENRPLQETQQAFRSGVLIDQNGEPVYYEMLVNEDLYNYITRHRLHEAASQVAYAQARGIKLPAGPSDYGPTGAIEIKAAWKIMSAAELAQRPVRFHTRPAVLAGGRQVTVGLVGLHIHQRIAELDQGAWATFGHVDNSPVGSGVGVPGSYSFFNPACDSIRCPPNAPTTGRTPTQVVQVFRNTDTVARINAFVRNLMGPDLPWRYYELLGVQWPTHPEPAGIAGQSIPLPVGMPNANTMVNPVLETFLQNTGMSCLSCHNQAYVANTPGLAAGYSFLLLHAKRE